MNIKGVGEMKAKKLVTLAIPVMLLSGCITVETSKKEEPKQESTKAKSSEQDKNSANSKDSSVKMFKWFEF